MVTAKLHSQFGHEIEIRETKYCLQAHTKTSLKPSHSQNSIKTGAVREHIMRIKNRSKAKGGSRYSTN